MRSGLNQYPPMPGVPALREAVAAKIASLYGHAYDAGSEITITAGATQAILTAILALVHPGDEVIVPDPGYPIYESLTRFVGATAVPIPIRMANDFRLDVDELAALITPRTRVLFVNSPANPTGGVLTRGDLERIATLAIKHRLPAVYDRTDFVEAGGLLSYGVNLPDLSRRAAEYVDQILKGKKPGDLTLVQPTKFDLAVNLKTAKAIGVTVPTLILLRANEVIE